MGFSFFETMRGHLVDDDGDIHLIDFEIKVEATHLTHLLLNGLATITGVVRAAGWGHDVPLEGTLRISPIRDRRIEYDFEYQDEEGHNYHFFGHKDLDFRRPLASMTLLFARLERDGELVGEGEMTFDLNDLPSFLTSWQLSTSFQKQDMAAVQDDTPAPDALSADERRTLRAYGEAIIVPGRRIPAVDDTTMANMDKMVRHMPTQMRTAYRGLLRALDGVALAKHQKRFASLPLDTRRKVATDLNEPGNTPGQTLTLALSSPFKVAHYSRREYLDAIGVPTYENPVKEATPRWMANVMTPEDLEQETTLPADVVVIGTGAGGGPMAARLAEQGFAVAVIEEGRYHRREQFSGPPEDRMLNFWRDSGMQVTIGNMPITIPTGKMVGGSTAINSGTCFPTPDAVLATWRNELGLPDDFTPEAFGPYLQSVMEELQVKTADARYVGEIGALVGRGAEAMAASEHGPLPRNAPGCDGQGVCVFGCPTGAKRSTDVSYIPRALKAGATVFTGLPVTRILRRGRNAVAVEARGQDQNGAPRVLRIRASAIVVCCGTLGTPMLLQDNGIDLPALGKNMSIHPAYGMLALSREINTPWHAIPQGYGVEGLFDDARVRFEGYWAPPQVACASIALVGDELCHWMDQAHHVGQYGFMVKDPGRGSVRRVAGQPIIRYSVSRETFSLLQRGAAILAELLLRGGAEEVLASTGPIRTVRSIDEARRIAEIDLKPSDLRSAAFHPLGTCRMGPDPETSVVDFEHRVHGLDNLYVVDGSAVPTSLGVNPQVTIMAMAERAAERLGQRLTDQYERSSARSHG